MLGCLLFLLLAYFGRLVSVCRLLVGASRGRWGIVLWVFGLGVVVVSHLARLTPSHFSQRVPSGLCLLLCRPREPESSAVATAESIRDGAGARTRFAGANR